MATLTVTMDPAVLKAAEREAERRNITLNQLVVDSLTSVARQHATDTDDEALIRLMYKDRIGNIDVPLTREEIYAERTWPRS